MKSLIFITISLPSVLYAVVHNILLDNPRQYQEQKKIYDAQTEQSNLKTPIYTETKLIREINATQSIGKCIPIKQIILVENTLLDEEEQNVLYFKHVNRCNTLIEINNLVTKINNIYMEKSYVTSRAYIKAQKLSTGILKIHAMEGKIESVEEKNVNAGLVLWELEDKHFHLREVETYIEQLNRLQSKKVTVDVEAGSKVGYSKLLIKGEDVAFPINGFIGTDNYSYEGFDKFQINGSLEWENPLGLQDLLRVNINMTNKQEKTDNALGSGVSYGFPVYRSYIEVGYFKFDYSNLIDGLNTEYLSEGSSVEYYLKSEYKLFHTKYQRGKIDFSYTHKKNENFLDNIQLDTSSNELDVLRASYTHEFIYPSWSLFSMVAFQKSFNGSYVNKEETDEDDLHFEKLLYSINGRIQLLEGMFPLDFSSSLYGQYGSEGMVATEQIGIGGSYSVRGFENKDQLSSNFGFYIRNDLTTMYRFNNKIVVKTYLGLDYGWADENPSSYGGYIAGVALGARLLLYGLNLDLLYPEHSKTAMK